MRAAHNHSSASCSIPHLEAAARPTPPPALARTVTYCCILVRLLGARVTAPLRRRSRRCVAAASPPLWRSTRRQPSSGTTCPPAACCPAPRCRCAPARSTWAACWTSPESCSASLCCAPLRVTCLLWRAAASWWTWRAPGGPPCTPLPRRSSRPTAGAAAAGVWSHAAVRPAQWKSAQKV